MGGSVTSPSQLQALALLAPALPSDAYLAGGVAVALYADHRTSHDLDIFTQTTEPEAVVDALGSRGDVRITTRSPGTVYLELLSVPVSIIRHAYPLLTPAEELRSVPVRVASAADLTAMKLHAIASRGAARDFWDLHALLSLRTVTLSEALDEHARRYPSEDRGHVIRSLAYFGDAESAPLPAGLDEKDWKAIRAAFERWVPHL